MTTAIKSVPVLQFHQELSTSSKTNPKISAVISDQIKKSQFPSRNTPPSPHAYDRAIARISSLEKTIEYLQETHGNTLKGLHEEIKRLQEICAETNLKAAFKTEQVNKSKQKENRATKESLSNENELITHTKPANSEVNNNIINEDIESKHNQPSTMKSIDDAISAMMKDNQPIYLIVDQQRKKYRSVIGRLGQESKRKQAVIDELQKELNIFRDVFKLSNLNMDLQQMEALVRPPPKNRKDEKIQCNVIGKHSDPHSFGGAVGSIERNSLTLAALPAIEKTETDKSNRAVPPLEEEVKGTSKMPIPPINADGRPTSASFRSSKYLRTHTERSTNSMHNNESSDATENMEHSNQHAKHNRSFSAADTIISKDSHSTFREMDDTKEWKQKGVKEINEKKKVKLPPLEHSKTGKITMKGAKSVEEAVTAPMIKSKTRNNGYMQKEKNKKELRARQNKKNF